MATVIIAARVDAAKLAIGIIVFGTAAALGETVNLATFYPSPAGVYWRITTHGAGTMIFARDDGSMVVGATSNPGTDKLYVNGTTFVNGIFALKADAVVTGTNRLCWNGASATSPSCLSASQGGSIDLGGDGSAANPVAAGRPFISFHYGNGFGQSYNARIINQADARLDFLTASGGTVMTLSGNAVGIRNASPVAALDVGGEGVIVSRQAGCYVIRSSGACAANQYKTLIGGRSGGSVSGQSGSGLSLSAYASGGDTESYLCCPCGAAGCAGFP
jgi:hypothetical protein